MKRYEYASEVPNNGWDGMMAMLERRGQDGWHLSATWGDWFLFARLLPEPDRVEVKPPEYNIIHPLSCASRIGLPCNCLAGVGCAWCGKVVKQPCVGKVAAKHCTRGVGEPYPPVTAQEEEAFREKERVVSLASVQHDLRQLDLPQLYEVLDSVRAQMKIRYERGMTR